MTVLLRSRNRWIPVTLAIPAMRAILPMGVLPMSLLPKTKPMTKPKPIQQMVPIL